jgi:hypothetical protein
VLALLLSLVAAPAAAGAFYSKKEALALAFPDADRIDDETFVLDDTQVSAIEALAHAPVESRLVTLYTGYRGDQLIGHALIDVHTVRTHPEAFLVVIDPAGSVRSLRVLAFYEPEEYLPPDRWLRQFDQQALTEDLRLQGRIHGIAGSTLSARAVTGGVRRALALYEVLVNQSPRAAAESTAPAGL